MSAVSSNDPASPGPQALRIWLGVALFCKPMVPILVLNPFGSAINSREIIHIEVARFVSRMDLKAEIVVGLELKALRYRINDSDFRIT